MDGFFVAKFKVMKKTQRTEAAVQRVEEEMGMDMSLDSEADQAVEAGNATFDNEEDDALIRGEFFRPSVCKGERLV